MIIQWTRKKIIIIHPKIQFCIITQKNKLEKNIYCRASKFNEKIFSIFYKSRVLYMKYIGIFVFSEMSNWPHSVSWFPELQLTNWNGNCNCNSSRKNRLNGSGNGNCDFQKMSHSTPIPLQFTLQFYLGSIFLAHYYSVFPPTEILDKNAMSKTPS